MRAEPAAQAKGTEEPGGEEVDGEAGTGQGGLGNQVRDTGCDPKASGL